MTEITHILNQVPSFIFWKDRNLKYLGANDLFLKSAGLCSANDIVGKNDFQMPWNCFAEKYRADDTNILLKKESQRIEEYHKDISGQVILVVVNKKPLFDENHSLIGIIGTYTKYPTVNNMNNNFLSKRQKEVLEAMTKGLTAKEIGRKLGISYRTVEYYVELIKNKLECNSKAELIKCALSLGYFSI